LRFWQFSESVEESDFAGVSGAKAEGTFQSQFQPTIEALDGYSAKG